MVQVFPNQTSYTEDLTYFVRSTVLGGQVLTELDENGSKAKTKVYAGAGEIAEQIADTSQVVWKHRDMVTGGLSTTTTSGNLYEASDSDFNAELEPLGAAIPTEDPYAAGANPDTAPMPTKFKLPGNVFDREYGCLYMGAPANCGPILRWLNQKNPGCYIMSLWQYRVFQRNNATDTNPYKTTIGGDNPINIDDTDTLIDTYYSVVATPLNWTLMPFQTQQRPAPLTGKEINKFKEKQKKAVKRLNGTDCKKFLDSIKNYASIEEIENAISLHPAFSARNTKSLSLRNSGIFTAEQIQEIEGAPKNQGNDLAREMLDGSVSAYFENGQFNAITNQDPRMPGVYYYNMESQTVLHEAIHFATGLNDPALANALGLRNENGSEFSGEQIRAASLAIKNALNQECR